MIVNLTILVLRYCDNFSKKVCYVRKYPNRLVETSHTGNMGSAARAMKTMGLSNLYLVNPQVQPDSHAIALSAGASDVIGNAKIVSTRMRRLPVVNW